MPPGRNGRRMARGADLEIGTGSGYQAAILSELGAELTSVERHAELSHSPGRRCVRAGYPEVRLVVGDGTEGIRRTRRTTR